MLTISTADYLWFADQAIDEMVNIVGALGDDLANRSPALAGANSPYAILTHCLGVVEFWGGSVVAGREVERDREAEFVASGPVADLVRRAAESRRRLEVDLAGLDPLAAPIGPLDDDDAGLPIGRTQGGVLLHILQELTQHLGQMQLTRDVLLAG